MTRSENNTDIKQDLEETRQAAEKAALSPWMEKLVRVGFGARGLIYFLMGLIAFEVAFGARSAPQDQQGALRVFAAQPIGRVLLILVMIGLVGYSLWGLIRIFFDPLHIGSHPVGIVQRLWYFSSVASYSSLIIPTYGLITRTPIKGQHSSQTEEAQRSVSTIFQWPWGQWLVGIAGVIGIGIGLAQIYEGIRPKFDRQFHLYDLTAQQAKWLIWVGRIGTVARGIVFGLLGLFLVLAAYFADAQKAKGMDGALLELARQPYGFWLLGFVGFGLMAFGVYSFMGMFWFRMKKNKEQHG